MVETARCAVSARKAGGSVLEEAHVVVAPLDAARAAQRAAPTAYSLILPQAAADVVVIVNGSLNCNVVLQFAIV